MQEVEDTQMRVREKEARKQELLEIIQREMERRSYGNGVKEGQVVEQDGNSADGKIKKRWNNNKMWFFSALFLVETNEKKI